MAIKNPNWVKLGEIIRKSRDDISLAEFAKMTGLGIMTLSRIEKAESKPDIEALEALAPYTGYEVEQLVAVAIGKQLHTAVDVVNGAQVFSLSRKLPHPEIKELIYLLARELKKEDRVDVMKKMLEL